MKFEFSPQIFKKSSNFIKIFLAGAEMSMRTVEETDRHDEVNSRFSQFCEKA
jgi:hypothetical protein